MPEAPMISIVDDDQLVRESMMRLMRSLGYDFEVFSSAAEFLTSGRLESTDCLIADIHMPAMTGFDLHAHLVELGCNIPTILITGYHDDASKQRALKDGVLCYLRKPFDDEDLLHCIRLALDDAI